MPRTGAAANPLPEITRVEADEFRRLTGYLQTLDAAGWVEQSYCSDWRVYQVASHLGSGGRIGKLRLQHWAEDGPPVGREQMQQVWGYFDSRNPEQMLDAYAQSAQDYTAYTATLPADVGLKEVEGFAGKRPLFTYQVMRLWELTCHSWDIYVARDATARLAPAAVAVLAGNLQFLNLPIDPQRANALAFDRALLRLAEQSSAYLIDLKAERPRLQQASTPDAPLVVEGPAEEIIRLVSGRHFVPGDQPKLTVTTGQAQDLAALKRAFR